MNRLDSVLGPESWSDHYEPFGEHGCRCVLTITLPDGSSVTKEGLGGSTEMHDSSDTEKTGESDALKRAAVKLGIGRELYRDGVADFVAEYHGEPVRSAPARGGQQTGSPRQQTRSGDDTPRSGKALFAALKKLEEQHGVQAIAFVNGWAKSQPGFPARIVDFDADQAISAWLRVQDKLAAKMGRDPGEEG
jgi:hypothetical protein